MKNRLFTQFESPYLGKLKNRFVMSAMTRSFSDVGHLATDAMCKYYARRADHGVGLILTEGVIIHQQGDGYNNVPYMATKEQAQSWMPAINGVHLAGSKIFCQLWHCGRISHSDYTGPGGPVSSTSVAATGINRQNNKPFGVPIALTTEGMAEVIDQYVNSTALALEAGFDGVELHLGHGYLADQFLDARINDRTDNYGGSVQNRCRFPLELLERILGRFPSKNVLVRISPSRDMGGIYDWPDLDEMLKYLIPEMWQRGLRNLDVSCARADYYQTSGRIIRMIRPYWKGVMIGGASLNREQATKELEDGLLDLVTWGRFLIADFDLVRRMENNQDLTQFEPSMLKKLE